MASAAELKLVATVQDKASAQLARMQKRISSLEKSVAKAGRSFKLLGPVLGGGAAGLGGAILASGASFNELRDRATRAFTSMLGDGAKATAMIDQLATVAENSSFGFEDVTRAAQRMLAFGIAAEDVIPTIKAVNGAVTAMGGSGEQVNKVIVAIGQMSAKGKTSAEEMLQLAEAGIPAWQILAENIDSIFGPEKAAKMTKAMDAFKAKTVEQLVAKGMGVEEAHRQAITMATQKQTLMLMKMAEQGQLPADKVIRALRQGMTTRFGKLGEMKESEKTPGEKLEALSDRLKRLFGDLTKGPLEQVGYALSTISEAIQWLNKEFNALDPTVKTVVSYLATLTVALVGFGAAIAGFGLLMPVIAGIGTAFGFIGTVIGWMAALAVAITPVGWAIIAVVVAVGALTAMWMNDFLGLRTWLTNWWAWAVNATGDFATAVVGFFESLKTNVVTIVTGAWTSVRNLFTELVASVTKTINDGWTTVVGWFTWLGTETARAIDGAWAYVYGAFVSGVNDSAKWLSDGWTTVVSWFTWLGTETKRIVDEVWAYVYGAFVGGVNSSATWLSDGWTTVVGWFTWLGTEAKRIIDGAWGAVYGTFAWLIESAQNYLAYGWDTVVGIFASMVGRVQGIVSDGFQAVGDWFSWLAGEALRYLQPILNLIDKVKGFVTGGGSTTTGRPGNGNRGWVNGVEVPGFATGGIVRSPTLAMIGERGPEAVIPLGRMGGAGGTVINNFYLNAGVVTTQDAQAWWRRMQDEARSRGGVD